MGIPSFPLSEIRPLLFFFSLGQITQDPFRILIFTPSYGGAKKTSTVPPSPPPPSLAESFGFLFSILNACPLGPQARGKPFLFSFFFFSGRIACACLDGRFLAVQRVPPFFPLRGDPGLSSARTSSPPPSFAEAAVTFSLPSSPFYFSRTLFSYILMLYDDGNPSLLPLECRRPSTGVEFTPTKSPSQLTNIPSSPFCLPPSFPSISGCHPFLDSSALSFFARKEEFPFLLPLPRGPRAVSGYSWAPYVTGSPLPFLFPLFPPIMLGAVSPPFPVPTSHGGAFSEKPRAPFPSLVPPLSFFFFPFSPLLGAVHESF